jgi:DNA-binding transcriptional MerR regulator
VDTLRHVGNALVTAAAAAKHLGVSVKTLRRWTASGLIPSMTDPDTGRVRYSIPALDLWLANNGRTERAS